MFGISGSFETQSLQNYIEFLKMNGDFLTILYWINWLVKLNKTRNCNRLSFIDYKSPLKILDRPLVALLKRDFGMNEFILISTTQTLCFDQTNFESSFEWRFSFFVLSILFAFFLFVPDSPFEDFWSSFEKQSFFLQLKQNFLSAIQNT